MLKNVRKEASPDVYNRWLSVFFVFLHVRFYFRPRRAYNKQMNATNDIELMLQVRHGSQAALRELIERYRVRLYRLAYNLLDDRAAADDAVQETFIRLWQQARRFRTESNVSAWLCTICARRCYDELRRRRRHREAVAQLVLDDVRSDTLEVAELRALLQRVVATLPAKQRVVYQLREIEQMSADEVASATRLSVDQVKANLYLARNTVREKLKQYGI